MKILLITALILVTSSSSVAACYFDRADGDHFEAPNVRISSDPVLLVTHATSLFDGRQIARNGTDQTVAFAKSKKYQVVYLQTSLLEDEQKQYYYKDCRPDFLVISNSGSFVFDLPSHHVITVGGHWQACQKDTLVSVLKSWSKRLGHFRITYVMNGIYIFPHVATPQDTYYEPMMDYLKKVNPEGRPSWQKLNLTEMLNFIPDENLKSEYLKRMTPPKGLFDFPEDYNAIRDVPAEFEMRLELNGKDLGILRAGTKPDEASITFSYVDSLELP